MALQILPYAHVFSPSMYEEDDLNLNLSNCKDQSKTIEQINIEAERELAEIEAELQKKRTAVENRRIARTSRINSLYENAIFVQNGPHKNIYPAPKEFIKLIENELGIINFVKQPEIAKPTLKTAFTIITAASYVYVFPSIQEKAIQLIEKYLRRVPVVGPIINSSLQMGLRIINLPHALFKKAWDPTKISQPEYNVDHEGYFNGFIFNEDGTPKMYETSNRETTKYRSKVIAIVIAVKYGPSFIRKLIDTINELRVTHLSNQDWARTFFSSYFEWKVRKLRDMEAQYSIPDIFQNDVVLNQPKYRCAGSGQFLIIPFKTPSNIVFQYSVIEDWLLSHHTCPVTEENLQANQLSFDAITYNEIRDRLQAINR